MFEKIKTYAISILIALAVGGLSAFFTRNSMNLYRDIITPPLSPPSILFPIVWTVLFILMGISAAMIYLDKNASGAQKSSALATYILSLIVNFFWSLIFFNLRAFLFAFLWLLLLLYLVIRTIMKYYKINRVAAYLQIPYALWVTFAGYLTFAIWYLNR
ncbi:MAG: tryptophan-rich sensory protein [Clostridia bacterium]|nr:tryptophan-rich sensory protein [Clostridia bacterium]MBR6741159.1 tryptophan-rich sensory protein [Clostridia bacterium]